MISEESKKALLDRAFVVGVGKGTKEKDGEDTGEECITVMVRKKQAEHQLNSEDVIPKQIDGVKTDVVEVGLLTTEEYSPDRKVEPSEQSAISPVERHRPFHMGVSIGPFDRGYAGTAGFLAYRHSEEEFHGLKVKVPEQVVVTNNHVGADEGTLDPGAIISQPGLLDGGKAVDEGYAVMELIDYVEMEEDDNKVDLAVLGKQEKYREQYYPGLNSLVSSYIPLAGVPHAEIGEVEKGDTIVKGRTRTTSRREGKVKATEARIRVKYNSGVKEFKDQIVTEKVSRPGDSGSLGLYRGRPFGLLFAGSDSVTVFNKMENVLEEGDLSLKPELKVIE